MRTRRFLSVALTVGAFILAGCGGAAAPASSTAPSVSAPASKASTSAPAASSSAAPASSSASAKPGAQPAGPPVKIGFIAPLSGAVAVYGAAVKYAPEMVTSQTNASGGINGSPMQVVTVDSPNSPDTAATNLRRLANEDKVIAVVGPYYTAEMQVAAPIANQLKIPVLGYTVAASDPGVIDPGQWVFLDAENNQNTTEQAIEAYKKVYPNVKKVVVVGDSSIAVTAITIKNVWPKLLPDNGYTIADTVTFSANTSDFSPIVTRIKASGADGIALSALSPAGPNLLKQLKSSGVNLPLVLSAHMHTAPPLPAILGPVADGLIQTMFWSPERAKDPRVQKWAAQYEQLERGGGTNVKDADFGYAQEPETYDIFSVLAKVARDAGIKGDTPPDQARAKMQQGLKALKNYPGISANISIDSTGHISYPAWPLIAKNGVYESIP